MSSPKSPRLDGIRTLMSARTADEKSRKPAGFDDLMSRLQALQTKVEQQQALISSLEHDASSDALTGLANRRTLEKELERSLATARRYNRTHALLMLDINEFKSINDQLGHPVGDQVLQHVARLLRQNIRPTDIAARLGGDEFCVILNELRAVENAHNRAADIAHVIARTPCLTAARSVQLSASIGVCVFGADDDAQAVMAKADESMYAQKHNRGENPIHG